MRLFVAAWPSPEVRAALRSIPRPDDAGVRWTPEASWHVTLRFLGEVAGPDEVVGALEAELPGRGARTATLGDATSLLGSVLVVRVDGLRSLATLVRLATARIGDPPRPDPFVGHITVARARRRRVDPAMAGHPVARVDGTWSVGEVTVVRSVPGGGPGAPGRYETLAAIPLG